MTSTISGFSTLRRARRLKTFGRYSVASALTACAVMGIGTANAGTIFPAGTESKAAGGDSVLSSAGAPALLYNPANLDTVSSEKLLGQPYAELGFVNVKYTYEHPDFDPVTVNVNSPTLTLGYAKRLSPNLTLGFVIFPSKNGETAIPGLPRKVGDTVTPVSVKTEDRVIDVSVGMGVKVGGGFSCGLAADVTDEKHELTANLIDNANALVTTRYENRFVRPVAGARFDSPKLVGGAEITTVLAVKTAQVKRFDGSEKTSTDAAATNPRVVDYEPRSIGAGVEARWHGASFGVEARQLAWAAGRGIVKNATYEDAPDADLKDVVEYNLTAGMRLPRHASLSFGYGVEPSPWGAGRDDGTLSHHELGADYGRLDALDRRTLALGGALDSAGRSVSVALSRTHGERTLSGAADNVGFYSLDVNSLSASFRADF